MLGKLTDGAAVLRDFQRSLKLVSTPHVSGYVEKFIVYEDQQLLLP